MKSYQTSSSWKVALSNGQMTQLYTLCSEEDSGKRSVIIMVKQLTNMFQANISENFLNEENRTKD